MYILKHDIPARVKSKKCRNANFAINLELEDNLVDMKRLVRRVQKRSVLSKHRYTTLVWNVRACEEYYSEQSLTDSKRELEEDHCAGVHAGSRCLE